MESRHKGSLILTGFERAEQEKLRAEQEKYRAEQERLRAEKTDKRIDSRTAARRLFGCKIEVSGDFNRLNHCRRIYKDYDLCRSRWIDKSAENDWNLPIPSEHFGKTFVTVGEKFRGINRDGCAVINLYSYHISVKIATQRCEAQQQVHWRGVSRVQCNAWLGIWNTW